MRAFKLFIFLILNLQLVYSKSTEELLSLLEAGDFKNVEKILDEIKDENKKTFMNSIYYLYSGDYEKAYEYISKTSSESISQKDLFFFYYIPYIYQLFKEGYKKYETENFIIYLKGKDEILKDLVLENFTKIFSTYNEKFKYYPEDKIRIEIYSTKEEFCNASTLPEEIVKKTGVVGICKFNRIMILSPENLPYGYRWLDTLAHEYIHFLLNRITKFRCPLYLHEGTARYFDTLYRSTYPLCFSVGNLKELLKAKRNNELIPFEKFKGSLVYLDTQKQIELAFVELASFVDYLINNYGEEKFIDVINKYSNFNDEKMLYRKIFNREYQEIISDWLESIERKNELIEKYPGAMMDVKILSLENEKELLTLDIYQYVELGDKFLEKKQYKAALYQYRKAQNQQPYNPFVMTKLAKVLLLLKDFKNAEEILKECINVNPNFAGGYELIIQLYYETSDYFKALEYYRELLQINPFNYKIRKIIAEIYSDLGKLKEALYEYKNISLLTPQDKSIISIIDRINRYLEIKYQPK